MSFLSRLTKLDWPTLIVELVLIFVGITAALWFDNRNQAQRNRGDEIAILGELASALNSDIEDLDGNIKAGRGSRHSIDAILGWIDTGVPYDSAMAEAFGRSTRQTRFLHRAGAYEYLKSVGLGMVTSDRLRSAITGYYEFDVQNLTSFERELISGQWESVLQPQMVEKFSYRFFSRPAVPNDWDALRRDREYRSALTNWQSILEWQHEAGSALLARSERLVEMIEAELAVLGAR
ncbi:MAG: hypothetical protein ACKVIN_04425 [Longimicrobiales bacterium]